MPSTRAVRRRLVWFPAVSLRRLSMRVLVLACSWLVPLCAFAGPVSVPPPEPGTELPAAEQRMLAERFAPVLVFHPDEKYFPTNPLFPLDLASAAGVETAPDASWQSRLGSVVDRRVVYESLALADKGRLATAYYRAYNARHDATPVVVIEYWLYYVQNTYRVRGNLFPFWLDGSHPNDLEHIHVVLQRMDDGTLALHEIYGSAHAGTMPPNRHTYGDGGEANDERVQFLVELGSHANAPDIDRDGLFTPGVDGSSGYKMLWGIRDRGFTWARYNSEYMDARGGGNSVVFEFAGAASGLTDRQAYRLVPVDQLREAVGALNLTKAEREAMFETDRNWFRRLFGGDNGSSAKLLMPPPRSEDRGSIGMERFASSERGFLVGTVLNMEQQGIIAAARYAYLLGGSYIPDLMFEANGVVNRHQRYLQAQMFVTYPLDGSTTLMFGRALVTDTLHFERRQWDWVGGVEFPVGHMRVYVATRTWGPITNYSQEVRLS